MLMLHGWVDLGSASGSLVKLGSKDLSSCCHYPTLFCPVCLPVTNATLPTLFHPPPPLGRGPKVFLAPKYRFGCERGRRQVVRGGTGQRVGRTGRSGGQGRERIVPRKGVDSEAVASAKSKPHSWALFPFMCQWTWPEILPAQVQVDPWRKLGLTLRKPQYAKIEASLSGDDIALGPHGEL